MATINDNIFFVGLMGAGKTTIGKLLAKKLKKTFYDTDHEIEKKLGLSAHRIAAHRALTLNPGVPKITEKLSRLGLQTGYPGVESGLVHRDGQRWGQ